uniref:RRM domain-containing protein n=1 Tax=Setaria digitata TaxID=48799 RepID=A0A915PXF9_9BILA
MCNALSTFLKVFAIFVGWLLTETETARTSSSLLRILTYSATVARCINGFIARIFLWLPPTASAATLFPHTVAATFGNISQSGSVLSTLPFYPLSACTTAALIPGGEAQTTLLPHPNPHVSVGAFFHQQYPNFQPSAIATATFLSSNILRNTGISGIPLTATNKRKSSTIYSGISGNKLYRGKHFATVSESPSTTPVNTKKTCLKLDENPFSGAISEISPTTHSFAAACMAASPIRPIIGQQQQSSQQQLIIASDISNRHQCRNHHHRHPNTNEQSSRIAVTSSTTANIQESVCNRRQHSSMEQVRQQSQSQTQQSQSQQDSQEQMRLNNVMQPTAKLTYYWKQPVYYSIFLSQALIFRRDNTASNLLVLGNGSTTTGAAPISASALDISACTQQQPNSVLRVIIENMLYPVTLDVLHQIFSRYGKNSFIPSGDAAAHQPNTFQALVQLSEANSAQLARQSLDGQNVYSGCCCLRIDYSKLATLNVKYNNDKSRDYTNPNLPSGELTLEQQLSLVSAATGGQMGPAIASLVQSPFAFPFGAANPQFAFQQQAAAFPQADALASPTGISPFLTGLTTTLASGATSPVTANAAMINATAAALRFPHVNVLNMSSVVLVSNLNENNHLSRISEQENVKGLETWTGVYGDVHRVKILFNKKDNALIQYAEPQQAQLAIQHLDKVRWHDKQIRVATSKHSNVQMPKEGQPDAGLTRDYSQSSLHRFKKPGSKNYLNIYPPSSTLHLSNIPPNITEEFLTSAFEQRGYVPKGFKFFPKDHKMALLQLNDVETAINALIEMHNFKLAENAHLRVSFSKSGI